MILEHYAARPVSGPLRSVTQSPEIMSYRKPNGFWVSVKGEDDWPNWCRSEEFGLDKLVVCHRVELAPSANILHLPSVAAIDDFTAEYLRPGPVPYLDGIAWPLVARAYDGIIIAPYQWERRLGLSTNWYYGWDCASGCIWNADAVASVTPQTVEPA